MRTPLIVAGAGLAGVLLAAAPAGAHVGGNAAGLAHPFTGVDHLLAMVAVGVVAAVAGRRRWLAPATFLGGMVAGGVAGLAGVALPGAELLIVASVIVLGLVVAGALRGTTWLVALGLAVAGAAHGHAHGAEAPEAANALAYVAGFVGATASLHLLGMALGAVVRDRRSVRLGLGLATATAGVLLLGV